MMRWVLPLACAFAFVSPSVALQQPTDEDLQTISSIESAKGLESQVKRAHAIALPASVGIEVLGETTGGRGSGTIISADGWILTAGHVIGQPDLPVVVHLANGKTVEGRTSGLRWHGIEDCGLIRFDPTGLEFSAAQLGDGTRVRPGDWVIAMGHTYGIEKDPFRPPVLRLGRVRACDTALIHLDAPLSPGDSGGGVFDMEGRLIGINSTTGPELNINTATGIEFAKQHMSDMQQGASSGDSAAAHRDAKGERVNGAGVAVPAPPMNAPGKDDQAIEDAIASAVDSAILMTTGIYIDSRQVGYGTVASADGFIIAKASDVGAANECVLVAMPDGLSVCGTRMAVDAELDLVLIKTEEALEEPQFALDAEPEVGAILLTVGRDAKPAAFGVRSLGPYKPGRSDVTAAYLGIQVRPATPEERERNGGLAGVMVAMVPPGTPAARAGVKPGDFITRIAGATVENQPQVGEAIRKHASGDVIDVVRVHGDGEEVLRARLAPRPRNHGASPSTPMFPASKRSSGFGSVLQHDTALRADQMGGPVVDLDGRVVGVNIARVDRTKTYALSSAVVKPAIDRMIAAAKLRTEPLPIVNPLDSGIAIRQDGPLTRLDANTAEILGATLRFAQAEDAPGCLESWIDGNDSARWVVEFTQPGDYAVRVMQSCPAECAGQDFAVSIGAVKLTATTMATADWLDFQGRDVGSFHVEEPGRVIIEINTGGQLKHPLMNLHAIELKRTS